MSLHDTLNRIESREDFIIFVNELLADFRQNGEGWENSTLDHYLGTIAQWTGDMDGYYQNIGEPVPTMPTWKTFADILMAARVYE